MTPPREAKKFRPLPRDAVSPPCRCEEHGRNRVGVTTGKVLSLDSGSLIDLSDYDHWRCNNCNEPASVESAFTAKGEES